jgi:hypothetical protein
MQALPQQRLRLQPVDIKMRLRQLRVVLLVPPRLRREVMLLLPVLRRLRLPPLLAVL